MKSNFDEALAALNTEGQRLGFIVQPSHADDIREIKALGCSSRGVPMYFKREIFQAWAYDVTVILHFCVVASGKLECSTELSWSTTGRSLSMAVASVALYQRAIEFAALAECIMTGIGITSIG